MTGSLQRRPAVEITVGTLNQARRDLEAELPDGAYEVPDRECRGLVLRVRPRGIKWIFRARLGGEFRTWTVAGIDNLTAPSKARERVNEARIQIRRGIDPAEWLREQELGGPVERTFDPATDGWTYGEAVDKYLDHVKGENRSSTYKDYKSCLKPAEFIVRASKPRGKRRKRRNQDASPPKDDEKRKIPSPLFADLQPLRGRLVKSITDEDIANVRSTIYNRGKRVQSNHVLRVLKAFFVWASKEPASGLRKANPAKDVPFLYQQKKDRERVKRLKARIPTIDTLAQLPSMLASDRVLPSIRIATRLAEFSAQRRTTVLSAEQDELIERLLDFDLPRGWGVWSIPSWKMKTDRPHNIPLPPTVWSLVQEARKLAGNSKWLFPQLRERRPGAGMKGHLSEKVINDALQRVGLSFGPHDFRRIFAKYGRMRNNNGPALSLAQIRLITHPAEFAPGDESLMGSYALDEFLEEKIEIMQHWCEWLDRLAKDNLSAAKPRKRNRKTLNPAKVQASAQP
jgi:integrase